MTENEPIKDYAADADIVTAETPAPVPAPTSAPVESVTSTGKKRGRPVKGTSGAETFTAPTPQEEAYMDEKTRLEIRMGAATLQANQERLKQAE